MMAIELALGFVFRHAVVKRDDAAARGQDSRTAMSRD